jgi:hypothetical protein
MKLILIVLFALVAMNCVSSTTNDEFIDVEGTETTNDEFIDVEGTEFDLELNNNDSLEWKKWRKNWKNASKKLAAFVKKHAMKGPRKCKKACDRKYNASNYKTRENKNCRVKCWLSAFGNETETVYLQNNLRNSISWKSIRKLLKHKRLLKKIAKKFKVSRYSFIRHLFKLKKKKDNSSTNDLEVGGYKTRMRKMIKIARDTASLLKKKISYYRGSAKQHARNQYKRLKNSLRQQSRCIRRCKRKRNKRKRNKCKVRCVVRNFNFIFKFSEATTTNLEEKEDIEELLDIEEPNKSSSSYDELPLKPVPITMAKGKKQSRREAIKSCKSKCKSTLKLQRLRRKCIKGCNSIPVNNKKGKKSSKIKFNDKAPGEEISILQILSPFSNSIH